MYSPNTQLSTNGSTMQSSPTQEVRVDRVNITITNCDGEEIMKTRIHPSLYIRQVKLDICRSKYATVTNPLDCFVLSFQGNVVENRVCIKSLTSGNDLQLQLFVDKSIMKSNEEKTTVLGTQNEISIENPNAASPREPAQGEKVPPVQSFITQRNPEGCFKWMATASFDESQFISTIEQARKGFPVCTYGKKLFPLLHTFLLEMCSTLKSPTVIATIMQWYRVVVLDNKPTELRMILEDIQLVLYTYLTEKTVVQSCVNTILVISDWNFTSADLELMCSTEFTYIINNTIKLYRQELWISSFFQFLQQLVFEIKDTRVEQVVSSYHLSLLSSTLLSNHQVIVFKALCSYLERIAVSQVPSIVLFNSDLLAILASILQTSKIDEAENVISILRVFVAFSSRKELNNLIIESNITSLLIHIINSFISNRSIIQLILKLLQNLATSAEICCYLYFPTILEAFQMCLSVYRDSDIKIIHACYYAMYLILRKNDTVIQYLNEIDIDLIMNYCVNYCKETTFLLTLLQLITVVMQRSSYFAMIRTKKYEKILHTIYESYRGNKVVSDVIQYILSKEDIEIPQSEIQFELPSCDEIMNHSVNGEQIMKLNKLYYLLFWRITHSSNIHLLETASQTVADFVQNDPSIITETLSYLPTALFEVFRATKDSLLYNKAVVTIIKTIVAHQDAVDVPREYVPILLDRTLKYIFTYDFVLNALYVIQYIHKQHPDVLEAESSIVALHRIQFATHSIKCREIVTALLEGCSPARVELPKRNDNLEDCLFAATVTQLASESQHVVIEAIQICSNAVILFPSQFTTIFVQEKGYSRLLGILRHWDSDEILQSTLDFIKVLYNCKEQSIDRSDLLPTVAVLYKVIRIKAKNKQCVELALSLLRLLSNTEPMLDRVMNNVHILKKLLLLYAIPTENETPSIAIVTDTIYLLSSFVRKNPQGFQMVREKVFSTLTTILSSVQEKEISGPCFDLFLLLRGEQTLPHPCECLIVPCTNRLAAGEMGSELFQILDIFSQILRNNSDFGNQPIHTNLLLRLGLLESEYLFGEWNRTVMDYVFLTGTLKANQFLLVSSGFIPHCMEYLDQHTTTINVDLLEDLLYFLSKIASNSYVRQFLSKQMHVFISLIHCYLKNESVIELILSVIFMITNSNPTLALHSAIEAIEENYPYDSDVVDQISIIENKWQPEKKLDMSSSLNSAYLFLVSSSEQDVVANVDVMLQLIGTEGDDTVLTELKAISTSLFEWIETNELIAQYPVKIAELLNAIISQALYAFPEHLSRRLFHMYCGFVSLYYSDLQTSELFSNILDIINLFFVANVLVKSLTESVDALSLLQTVITSEEMCRALIDVHVVECLFTYLSVVKDTKRQSQIFSLLFYLSHFDCVLHAISSQPLQIELLTSLKTTYLKEGEMELYDVVCQIVERVRANPSEEEILNAVTQKYGSIPEGNAPECT